MIRVLAVLLLTGASAAHAEDYAALFEEAAAKIDWNLEESWAFTESRLNDEQEQVARFDPRRSDAEPWELLSVDGRTPTDEERREFADDKEGYERRLQKIIEHNPLFDHETLYPFDTYMYLIQAELFPETRVRKSRWSALLLPPILFDKP